MVQPDMERRLAITELLAQPDPPELRRRGHRRTIDGKPERYQLVPAISAAFIQKTLLMLQERRATVAETTEQDDIRWVPQMLRPKEVLTAV